MVWEHQVMQAVQSLAAGRWIDLLFASFTFLGEEIFLLAAVFVVYWGVDRRLGERLLFSLYTTLLFNLPLKAIVQRPRPFLNPDFQDLRWVQMDGLVNTVNLNKSGSFPSGHAQCAGTFWSVIGRFSPGHWPLCILFIISVMLSRIYLGVHYPSDVLFGAFAGIVIAFCADSIFLHFQHPIHRLFSVLAAASLLVVFFLPSHDLALLAGLGVGALCGFFVEHRFISFQNVSSLRAKLLRIIPGLFLIFTLKAVLSALCPEQLLFDFLRYFIIAFFALGIWPFCFSRFPSK